jgi:hypothetical protein
MKPASRTDPRDLTPSEFYLSQNYPDPFAEKTTVKFCVPYGTRVTLEVFDSEGVLVKTLLDEEKAAGTYEAEFLAGSANNVDTNATFEGIYSYTLRAGDFSETKTMVLQRRQPSGYPPPGV